MADLRINKKGVESIINQIVAQIHLEDGIPVADCIEKQIPRLPFIGDSKTEPENNIFQGIWACSRCGMVYETDKGGCNYCPECGQRINWEGVQDNG